VSTLEKTNLRAVSFRMRLTTCFLKAVVRGESVFSSFDASERLEGGEGPLFPPVHLRSGVLRGV